jgi:hypothetical protein
LPDTCTGSEVVAVEFERTVPTAVFTADDVVDIEVLVVEVLESWIEVAEVVVELVVAELVVAAAKLVDWALEILVLDDAAGGGMTLKLTVAPQSAREDPLGQQPPSVQ